MNYTITFEQVLAAKGISLDELGLREVGLHRPDALLAVEQLRTSSVPVLGGDVYFIRGERIEQAFANWHCDQHPGEAWPEFAEGSCGETTKYIEAFPHRPEVTPLFVVVVPRGGHRRQKARS